MNNGNEEKFIKRGYGNEEKFIKRGCGCECDLIDIHGGPTKLYINVCANHRTDHEFRMRINEIVASFDKGLRIPANEFPGR